MRTLRDTLGENFKRRLPVTSMLALALLLLLLGSGTSEPDDKESDVEERIHIFFRNASALDVAAHVLVMLTQSHPFPDVYFEDGKFSVERFEKYEPHMYVEYNLSSDGDEDWERILGPGKYFYEEDILLGLDTYTTASITMTLESFRYGGALHQIFTEKITRMEYNAFQDPFRTDDKIIYFFISGWPHFASVGPDGKQDIFPEYVVNNDFQSHVTLNTYDPTNGINSQGDIVFFKDR